MFDDFFFVKQIVPLLEILFFNNIKTRYTNSMVFYYVVDGVDKLSQKSKVNYSYIIM